MTPPVLTPFWGGPWNGTKHLVQPDEPEYRVMVRDYTSFSASLDYAGGYPQANFPDKVTKYRRFEGEFVDESLILSLKPKSLDEVIRHLASRNVGCNRCGYKNV